MHYCNVLDPAQSDITRKVAHFERPARTNQHATSSSYHLKTTIGFGRFKATKKP